MMTEQDKKPFLEALARVAAIYGEACPAERMVGYWEILRDRLPLDVCIRALKAHVADTNRGQFFPKPSDVLHAVAAAMANDGRPGPDEAWAIAIPLMDENETAVWTQEIASAWGMASAVYRDGDPIGARRTFLEVYQREVDQARLNGIPVSWTVSAGHDAGRRVTAIESAYARGKLTADQANRYLPSPNQISEQGQRKALPPGVSEHPAKGDHRTRDGARHVQELLEILGGRKRVAQKQPSQAEIDDRKAKIAQLLAEKYPRSAP